MPFPMLPFDMVWTGCTEYIPNGRRAAGGAGGAEGAAQDEAPEWRAMLAQGNGSRQVGGARWDMRGWSWCLGWSRCGCACTFPRKERGAKHGKEEGAIGSASRPLEQQFVHAGQALGEDSQQVASKQPVSGGQAGRQATQRARRCKKAARCKVCAAAARQVEVDVWVGATEYDESRVDRRQYARQLKSVPKAAGGRRVRRAEHSGTIKPMAYR